MATPTKAPPCGRTASRELPPGLIMLEKGAFCDQKYAYYAQEMLLLP